MSFCFPIAYFASKCRGLSNIIHKIEREKDESRKKMLITITYRYCKPSIWLMPLEYKNWRKIKELNEINLRD